MAEWNGERFIPRPATTIPLKGCNMNCANCIHWDETLPAQSRSYTEIMQRAKDYLLGYCTNKHQLSASRSYCNQFHRL